MIDKEIIAYLKKVRKITIGDKVKHGLPGLNLANRIAKSGGESAWIAQIGLDAHKLLEKLGE